MTTMSITDLQALIARKASENTEIFHRLTPQNGWMLVDDMLVLIQSDAMVAFTGLVEILMRQTADERINGGTCHRNKFGFSKKHVTRGTELAIKFLVGEELTAQDVLDGVKIASAYKQQLWMVRLGAVPMNHLNLRPLRNAPAPTPTT